MIEILPQTTDTCLAVQVSGKINGEEYQQFLDAVEKYFSTGEPVSLVMEVSGFDFYGDLESAKKDLKFGLKEYKHIHKAAFVGDQKWLGWFTRLIDPFTRTEEKQFAEGELQAAFNWAST